MNPEQSRRWNEVRKAEEAETGPISRFIGKLALRFNGLKEVPEPPFPETYFDKYGNEHFAPPRNYAQMESLLYHQVGATTQFRGVPPGFFPPEGSSSPAPLNVSGAPIVDVARYGREIREGTRSMRGSELLSEGGRQLAELARQRIESGEYQPPDRSADMKHPGMDSVFGEISGA